ncbi:TPM domain-containing protein [Mucilaginibacter limnophilus]|uniref:TPM domain-containing protein n=1 Tax=Mucilaginibacter limnophilus TaxID=1932778 RepID=A0A437MYT5_9SPHI|nr:TPM domain-containing protein [Mucilaginibacter limnophilus]RVU02814.1 TPM domain-containing protein [Mucilaginibacter limnophilus]
MKKFLSLILLTISITVSAQIPKPMPNTFVNDYAGLLDTAEIINLNKKINIIEKRAGIQLAIVLIDTLPTNYEIEDFSLLIGRKWGVGKNNDGLVYVAAISQRKQRLEVARNSEKKFTETRSQEILDGIKPYFREKDYYGGLNKLVEEIAYDLNVDFQTTAQQSAVKNAEKDGKWYEYIGGLLVFLAPFAVIYYIIKRRQRNRAMQEGYYSGYDGGGYGSLSAPRKYSSRPYSSSGLGTFPAGAATGYLANELMDKLSEEDKEKEEEEEKKRREQEEYEARHREDDESDYGNWGGGSGSSGRSQSSNSGFSGGGATSDW